MRPLDNKYQQWVEQFKKLEPAPLDSEQLTQIIVQEVMTRRRPSRWEVWHRIAVKCSTVAAILLVGVWVYDQQTPPSLANKTMERVTLAVGAEQIERKLPGELATASWDQKITAVSRYLQERHRNDVHYRERLTALSVTLK
ncbi:MAG: hypothetical protein EOM31_03220 [Bacteroidia bacterium]|nr:hypothetical protein [Bacteroidia bacterium]